MIAESTEATEVIIGSLLFFVVAAVLLRIPLCGV
jgi:hypothetical protein